MIVNGLSYLTSIKKLVIVNNEFGKQSFEALVKILTRPKILFDELRLSNCRMLPQTTFELCLLLNQVDVHLRKLSLVNASLNSESLPLLCEKVKQSKHMIELDISYNGLNSNDMAMLIQSLS